MLGGGDGVGRGSIDDEAAVLRGGGEVDIVDPHAGATHDLEPPLRRLEHVAPDLRAAPHDEGVAERHLPAQLVVGEAVGAVDVGELAEELQAGLAQLLGDENRRFARGRAGDGVDDEGGGGGDQAAVEGASEEDEADGVGVEGGGEEVGGRRRSRHGCL